MSFPAPLHYPEGDGEHLPMDCRPELRLKQFHTIDCASKGVASQGNPDSGIRIWLNTRMLPKRNLADPNYEPSDEDFRELCLKAFAGLKERRQLADRRLQEEIQRLRKEALAQLHAEADSESPMGH